jgi:hypothetical protein
MRVNLGKFTDTLNVKSLLVNKLRVRLKLWFGTGTGF